MPVEARGRRPRRGARTAAIAEGSGLRGALELGGWLYLLAEHGSTGTLLRLKL